MSTTLKNIYGSFKRIKTFCSVEWCKGVTYFEHKMREGQRERERDRQNMRVR